MKIGHISFCYRPIIGGQEIYIKNLIEVFRKRGYDNTVYQALQLVEGDDISQVFRIPYISKIFHSKHINLYEFNLFLFLTKRHLLKKEDILIVNYAFHSIPVWNLSSKTIILSHGIEWYLENQNINDKIHEFIARKSLNRFTIVANDTHYLRHLGINIQPGEKFFSEVAPKIWFIPNCVNTAIFAQNEGIKELKGKKIIIVPRQITEDRGIDLAIKSFKLFSSIHKDYCMYIVGSPKKGKYYKYCANLVSQYHLEDKVIFKGFIKNEEMPFYYNSAIMTIVPTLRREGTSLSALESMSCGTPTVSTNVAGLKDLPTLQADPTPEAITEKMLILLGNYDEIKRRQQTITRQYFTHSNWANAWLKVIENVKNSTL